MPYSPGTVEPRMAHSAWQSPDGVVLMGGYYSGDSTELVNNTDSISQFTLNDPVRLGSEENISINKNPLSFLVMPVPSITGERSFLPEGSVTGKTS